MERSEQAGYQQLDPRNGPEARKIRRIQAPIAGLSCQACAQTAENLLRGVQGVEAARVSFGARALSLELLPEASIEAINQALARGGYEIPPGALGDEDSYSDVAFAQEKENEERRRVVQGAWIAGVSAVLTFALAWWHIHGIWMLLLASLGVFVGGRRILSDGLRAARLGAPDMNTLVGIGALASLVAAVIEVAFPGLLGGAGHHAHAGPMILAFVLLGRVLEARTRARAGDALTSMMELAPSTAHVVQGNEIKDVALKILKPGMHILIRPGERVPVDGVVLEGTSALDESLLTGEPIPIERGPGERIHAGAVNGTGALTVITQGVGAESALGRITRAMREAQASRADSQRLADRVSAFFVPAVLIISAITFVAWFLSGAPPGRLPGARHQRGCHRLSLRLGLGHTHGDCCGRRPRREGRGSGAPGLGAGTPLCCGGHRAGQDRHLDPGHTRARIVDADRPRGQSQGSPGPGRGRGTKQ